MTQKLGHPYATHKNMKKDMQTKHKMDRMVTHLHDLSLTERATMKERHPFVKDKMCLM